MEQSIKDMINVRGLSGLVNLGNTCYMNSVVQCLFATDFLNSYIKTKKFRKNLKVGIFNMELDKKKHLIRLNPQLTIEKLVRHIKKNPKKLKSKYKNSLTYAFYQLFTVMWIENCKVEPKKFKHLIGVYCDKFAGFRQHDSEELLYFLLDRVHEETKTKAKISDVAIGQELCEYYILKKTIVNDIDSAKTEDKDKYIKVLQDTVRENYNLDLQLQSLEYWKKYVESNYSIITDIFTGLFCSEICCDECKNFSATFEPFNILELSLVKKTGEQLTTLKECLDEFSSPEKISYKCDICSTQSNKTEGTATKRMTIWKIPDKLIIQFKRFSTNNGRSSKNNSEIDFPIKDLSLESIVTPQNKENLKDEKFELYGTVNHFGDLGGGHYIAHCKNLVNSKWYEFNDSTLVHIPEHEIERVIKCQSVYIMFYENQKYNS
jgi:ubiquitin C-terminal hydrolase